MEVLQTWNADELADRYNQQYGIDIQHYLVDPQVRLQRDPLTGVMKFAGCRPGEGDFYDALATWKGYYEEEKWEFDQAVRLIYERDHTTTRILDVGCGTGAFLECCRVAGFDQLFGLEMSPKAIESCHAKRLKVIDERIETLAAAGKQYDVITAFQVLEHVNDPQQFFQSAAKMLRPGDESSSAPPTRILS